MRGFERELNARALIDFNQRQAQVAGEVAEEAARRERLNDEIAVLNPTLFQGEVTVQD